MKKIVKVKIPSAPIFFMVFYLILALLSIKVDYVRYITFLFSFMFIISMLTRINKIKIKYMYLFAFLGLYLILGLVKGSPSQIIKNISMLILNLTPFFIFDYLKSQYNREKVKSNMVVIKKIINTLLIYTITITTYYLFKNPYIARYMANFDPSTGIDKSMGININLPLAIGGGYVLVYGVILLPPLFIYLSKKEKTNATKNFNYILISIIILFFIIKSGFATAFLLSVGASLAVLLLSSKRKLLNKTFIFLIVLILLIIVSSSQLLDTLVHILSSLLPHDSIITVRLNEIVPALYNNTNNTSSFSIRLLGLKKSFDTIVTNPIFGVGYKVGFDYISISNYASLHTEWIDALAQYGVVFGGFLLLFIGTSFRDLVKTFKNTEMELIIKVLVMTVIILGFLNPIMTSSIYLILMVYIPCVLVIKLNEFEKEKK